MKARAEYLIMRIRLTGQEVLAYDEISGWPAEEVEEIQKQGYITQIDDADGIVCDQCDKHCFKTVEARKDLRSGNMIGTFFCEDQDNGGPVSIDLLRLQQWKIERERLKDSPYWQERIEDRYISFGEAKLLLGFTDKSYFSRLADRGIVKDNGKKGQERKLLLSSVLLYNNHRENEERLKRADELKADENAIPDRH